jgi:hypothetical protein
MRHRGSSKRVTEAELRAAAEYRGIELTKEEVSEFLKYNKEEGWDVESYFTALSFF